MKILVTGGAGYVGSHVVRHLVASGHNAIVYDNLRAGHRAAVGDVMLVEGDILDRERLTRCLRIHEFDAVMHFAAHAYVGESVKDPAKYWINNVVGTISLLDAMRDTGVGTIVFSSTCATYGVPERVPILESMAQRPVNPYGFTKFAIERVLSDYHRAYGLKYATLRYFNACGAALDGSIGEHHDPETHLIPLALEVALGKRPHVDVFGTDYPTRDGTCIRDYIHVEDLATAHTAALDRLGVQNEVRLNLGTGRGVSVREIVEACRTVSGHAVPVRETARRAGDPPELVADASTAKTVLGWRAAHTSIERIIESAWAWHSTHPQGFTD
jgi:UDP-glucose 4-epimerase